MEQSFKSRPSDIFLATFPKSGTTWLKAMIFATMTRTSYPLDQHPLHTYNPQECICNIEMAYATGKGKIVDLIRSPRMMCAHLPYSVLSQSITHADCRIVYVWRDPKDTLVSYWWFAQKILGGADKMATFDQLYEFFCEGVCEFGPIWDHILGYWEESKRRPDKVLLLKYDNILKEPVKHAKQLANFLGCPYSEVEETEGVVEQVVNLCSFHKLKNLDVNKDNDKRNAQISNAYFFRNGKAGDWKSLMTEDMAERLDAIIKEKFKGTELEI